MRVGILQGMSISRESGPHELCASHEQPGFCDPVVPFFRKTLWHFGMFSRAVSETWFVT